MKKENRRVFLQAGAAAGLASVVGASQVAASPSSPLGAPFVQTTKRTEPQEVIIGEGDYQYVVDHQFAELPASLSWNMTHNAAVDSNNNFYVIHEGDARRRDHPSIFVFDSAGKFVRAFGSQFQGGGHGIDIRKEGNQEFLYVAAYQGVKAFAKMTLDGGIVWYQKAPMESEMYAEGENLSTKPNWSRKGFLPTNFAFLDDGGFLLADGYGAHCIHRYDENGKWQEHFGGTGKGKGKFNLCHGLTIDKRPGREPAILVTDRGHHTLQYLSMDGEYLETLPGFRKPANVETFDNLLLVSELWARVLLMNEKNEIVAQLGEAKKRMDQIKDLGKKPDQWKDGEFIHPHDACFDREGNIFVVERVGTGRVTKLTRKS